MRIVVKNSEKNTRKKLLDEVFGHYGRKLALHELKRERALHVIRRAV